MINPDTLEAFLYRDGIATFAPGAVTLTLRGRSLRAVLSPRTTGGIPKWVCSELESEDTSMADAFSRLAKHLMYPDAPTKEPSYHVVQRAPGTVEIVCVPADSEQPSTVIRVASETPISTYPGWARAETFTSLEDAFEAFTKRTER